MGFGVPFRSADVPFFFVEGDDGGCLTVGLGWTVLFVVESNGNADHGVDAIDVEGEVFFKRWVDEADGGVLKDGKDVEGPFYRADHDGYALCGLQVVRV